MFCLSHGDSTTLLNWLQSLMRAITSAWTGNVFQDKNMTEAGEMYAREIIELFDRANTLSEFNSATYTGVSLLALTMWAKYAPETSVMKSKGREMLQYTWETVGSLYRAGSPPGSVTESVSARRASTRASWADRPSTRRSSIPP